MRQGPDIQYDYTTKCWYTQTHTHMPPSSSWERWQQSLAHSLFTHHAEISFRRIRTHTIKTLSLQSSTWCTTHRTQCSERWMNTPICTKENTMFCDDNKHSYTSAFFIPKWLRHAMDFINGSLHSISHTAHCNHYSNTRIASIIKHMHGWKRIWISFTHHSRVPKRNTWMSLTVLCLQSLSRDHNGFQLSKD